LVTARSARKSTDAGHNAPVNAIWHVFAKRHLSDCGAEVQLLLFIVQFFRNVPGQKAGFSAVHRFHICILLLEARPAEHRTALRWFEGYSGLSAAHRTVGSRFGAHCTPARISLCFALLAALRVIVKAFIVKE
jgi:hypothetical protein